MNKQRKMTFAPIFGAMLIPISLIDDPAPQVACNDRARETDVVAGDHNQSNETCFVITISVAGQSFSTPAQCVSGFSRFPSIIYKCQTSASDGNHCKARGVEVTYYSYTDGACPEPPDLSEFDVLDFASWADVPSALSGALRCKKPDKVEKKDWSALVIDCDNGEEEPEEVKDVDEVYVTQTGQAYTYRVGNGADDHGIFNFFSTEPELAHDISGHQLPGLIGAVAASHSTLSGTKSRCKVKVDYFEPYSSSPVNTYSGTLSGKVSSDGRFELYRIVTAINSEGKEVPNEHFTSYDGFTLRDLIPGDSRGNAHPVDSVSFNSGRLNYVDLAEPIYRWTSNPFGFPLYSNQSFTEIAGAEQDQIIVQRHYQSVSGPFVGLEYTIDVSSSAPRPIQRVVYGAGGFMLEKTVYSDFKSINDGCSRPLTTVRTVYFTGANGGLPRYRETLEVVSAAAMGSEDFIGYPKDLGVAQPWAEWH